MVGHDYGMPILLFIEDGEGMIALCDECFQHVFHFVGHRIEKIETKD